MSGGQLQPAADGSVPRIPIIQTSDVNSDAIRQEIIAYLDKALEGVSTNLSVLNRKIEDQYTAFNLRVAGMSFPYDPKKVFSNFSNLRKYLPAFFRTFQLFKKIGFFSPPFCFLVYFQCTSILLVLLDLVPSPAGASAAQDTTATNNQILAVERGLVEIRSTNENLVNMIQVIEAK